MMNQVDYDIQKSCMIAKMLKPFRNTHGRGGEGGGDLDWHTIISNPPEFYLKSI